MREGRHSVDGAGFALRGLGSVGASGSVIRVTGDRDGRLVQGFERGRGLGSGATPGVVARNSAGCEWADGGGRPVAKQLQRVAASCAGDRAPAWTVPSPGADKLAAASVTLARLPMLPHTSEPDLAAALAACAAPTAWVDPQGALLQANEAFTARFGRPSRLSALSPALDAPPASLAGGDAVPVDDGEVHISALGAGGDCWVQWLPVAGDRSAEQRQLQMFADTVAHDLRAPLRSIDSFARLLEDRSAAKLDATERMHLSRIRAAATRMSALLTALGELSRAASAQLNAAPVDLSLLAEWVLAELHDADAGRTVETEVQPGLLAQGDERLLKQLLHALLENAWKFTRGREVARIGVHGRVENGRTIVEVRDNGCGIDMQYAHKLFQPFQRLHGVEQGAGHGLGLSIAQRIARRHGGDVRAGSGADGSVFTLVLPAPTGEGGD